MSKESDAVRRQIAALEAELNQRQPSAKARKSTKETLLSEIRQLEAKVKNACGESFMDDEPEMYMGDESEMGYMDDDIESEEDVDFMDDDLVDEPVVLEEDIDEFDDFDDTDDFEEDLVFASEESDDVEDEISQDYLEEVLEEVRDPDTIVTNPSMLDAAPTNYVARLKSASARLDKVANYLEQKGNKKLALRIDKIADAIDARIKQEARNA